MDDLYAPNKNEEPDRDFLKFPTWFTNAHDTSLYLDEFLNAGGFR